MSLTHATLVLFLAAKIHGADAGVRAAAKNVVKKLPRSNRNLIYLIIDSKQSQNGQADCAESRQMTLSARLTIRVVHDPAGLAGIQRS